MTKIDPTIETEVRGNSSMLAPETPLETLSVPFSQAHAGAGDAASCPGARKPAHVAACTKCQKPTYG